MSEKPWETETPPTSDEELLAALKARADGLKIQYAPNIGFDTLKDRVDAAEAELINAVLVGSDSFPTIFLDENGGEVQLGQVVAEAHSQSQLDVAAWNELDVETRDQHIRDVVEKYDLTSEPTVDTDPLQDINAQKKDEPVSVADREATEESIDWNQQAPLEIINMVSQGISLTEARKRYANSRAGKKAEK